jgi:2-amino-4-hydroxy-6-hydroxymethyldihydropteridine diphosphokinase
MTIAYIGIGSNAGDRVSFVRRAVADLGEVEGVRVDAMSSLYETSPIGGPPQRSYVNAAVRIDTSLEPRALLETCKSIEARLGREPSPVRWGPRVIDLDILIFGEEKVSEPDLEIPHPRLKERLFALMPVLQIDPEVTDPWGASYKDALPEAEGEVEILESF